MNAPAWALWFIAGTAVRPDSSMPVLRHHSTDTPSTDALPRSSSTRLLALFALALFALNPSTSLAATAAIEPTPAAPAPAGKIKPESPTSRPRCLPDGGGYLRARLSGAIDTELSWNRDGIECTGAVRPTDGGIRMRFTGKLSGTDAGNGQLVLVFGIAGLREGQHARAMPVNVTVIREGSGEFYGTQGDDKCTLDEITQVPIHGLPHRARSYRVVARGFCTKPARAVRGNGALLISRFDYAGQVNFETEDETDALPTTESTPLPTRKP